MPAINTVLPVYLVLLRLCPPIIHLNRSSSALMIVSVEYIRREKAFLSYTPFCLHVFNQFILHLYEGGLFSVSVLNYFNIFSKYVLFHTQFKDNRRHLSQGVLKLTTSRNHPARIIFFILLYINGIERKIYIGSDV